jgi:DNA-binding IclR family transcriptional regulator
MLSRLPPDEVEAILDASTLCAYTPHTIWQRDEVSDRIRQTAERGYAICTGQILVTEVSVAAPVLDATGRAIGAVNLSVSKLRFDAAAADEKFAPLVCSTAQALSS